MKDKLTAAEWMDRQLQTTVLYDQLVHAHKREQARVDRALGPIVQRVCNITQIPHVIMLQCVSEYTADAINAVLRDHNIRNLN